MAKGNRYTKLFEWQKRGQAGGLCSKCNRLVSVLTVDHIVPVSILDMLDDTGEMKLELEKNFQLICYPCNRFKGCRLDKTNPLTKELLLELLK
jgi:5-methylcytosine-specific restriction endonuclease McrA